MPYQFEWDADKAAANLRKHGVSFDEAVTAFGDPLSVLLPDPDHPAGEERYLVNGDVDTGSAAARTGGPRRPSRLRQRRRRACEGWPRLYRHPTRTGRARRESTTTTAKTPNAP